MARREDKRHVFSIKRVILPLLLSFIFTIGAMVVSYRAVYTLGVTDEEPVEHNFVATFSFEEPGEQLRSDEPKKEQFNEQQPLKVRFFCEILFCAFASELYAHLIYYYISHLCLRHNLQHPMYRIITVQR